jgi:hypothetical protein
MRYFASLSLSVFSLLAPHLLVGAPINDNITNPTLLDANIVLNRFQGDVNGVTRDPITIKLPEYESPMTHPFPSVWFKWTAPVAGTVRVEAVASNFVVWGITLLGPVPQEIYDVVGTDYSSDIGSTTSFTSYDYQVEPGQVYLSGLMAYDIGSPNRYTYVHRFVQDALSDTFDARTQMGGTDFTVVGNNGAFTKEEGEPDHGSNPSMSADRSVWTTWRTPNSRKSVTLKATGKTFAPIVAVYTGTTLGTLKLVTRSGTASSSDNGLVSTASFVAEDGVDYHIAIDGDNSKSGAFSLGLKATTVRPGFLTSPVPTTVEQGATATFTANAAYTGETVTYQWQRRPAGTKTWTSLTDDDIFTGTQTSALTVAASLDMNGDRFRVLATDDVGTSASRAALLTVTEFAAIETEVLGTIAFDVITEQSAVPEPTNGGTYFVTGLPKGLSFNPATGEITGVIDAKPGVYRVVYGSTDGKVKNSETYVLQFFVSPLSSAFAGGFEALLRTTQAPVVPYGKVSFTVASNGTLSGTYFDLNEAKTYSFRSKLTLDQDLRVAGSLEEEPIEIKRGRSDLPLYLTIAIAEPFDPAEPALLTATLRDSADNLLAEATDGAPVGGFTAAQPAAWAGKYNGLLTQVEKIDPGSVLPVPGGDGLIQMSVAAKTGIANVRGRSAEGIPFTATLRGSPDGSYRLAQRAFAGQGGMAAGTFRFSGQLGTILDAYEVPEESGYRIFLKKPEAPTSRIYPSGYDVSYLLTVMPWVKPTSTSNLLAKLGVDEALGVIIDAPGVSNLDDNPRGLPANLRITATGKVTVTDSNSAKLSLTVNPTTGTFSGSFIVTDPPVPPSVKPVVRRVPVNGLLLQKQSPYVGLEIGGGYLLLPPLPGDTDTISGTFKILVGAEAESF